MDPIADASALPPNLLASLLALPTYDRLTVFHIEIYFSIQLEMHESSDEESDEPGVATQCWKQFSLSLAIKDLALVMAASA